MYAVQFKFLSTYEKELYYSCKGKCYQCGFDRDCELQRKLNITRLSYDSFDNTLKDSWYEQ